VCQLFFLKNRTQRVSGWHLQALLTKGLSTQSMPFGSCHVIWHHAAQLGLILTLVAWCRMTQHGIKIMFSVVRTGLKQLHSFWSMIFELRHVTWHNTTQLGMIQTLVAWYRTTRRSCVAKTGLKALLFIQKNVVLWRFIAQKVSTNSCRSRRAEIYGHQNSFQLPFLCSTWKTDIRALC
jgi:hypothetical protein